MAGTFEKHTRDFYQNYFHQWEYFGDPREAFSAFHPGFHGPFGKPSAQVRVGKRLGDQTLFEASYSFDSFGRRNTPLKKESRKKEMFALFGGGTQVFGEGVNDNETLPSYFQKLSPGFRSYNYGFLGIGPQNFLHRCQSEFSSDEISESEGWIFCFYRDDCIPLALGKASWSRTYPCYQPDSRGNLKFIGSFDEAKAPEAPDVYLPSDYTEEDFSITAAIYKSTQDSLKKIFPKSHFMVVIEPVTFTASKMAAALRKEKIAVLDLAVVDMDYLAWPHSRTFDTNLTPGGNQVLASLIQAGISDKKFAKELDDRRRLIESAAQDKDPKRAAYYGGFLFNYYDIFPMDDALDLVLRISKTRSEKIDEGRQQELLRLCQEGFQLKKDWLHKLRDKGIFDYKLRPTRVPSLGDTNKALGHELAVNVSSDLLHLFYETYFTDYERCLTAR